MSYTTTIDVFCDGITNGRTCIEWTNGESGNRVRLESWRVAKNRGWTQSWRKGRKIHLCPDCSEKAKLNAPTTAKGDE